MRAMAGAGLQTSFARALAAVLPIYAILSFLAMGAARAELSTETPASGVTSNSASTGTPGSASPHGFYLGFGLVREYLRLSLDDRAVLPDKGIEMKEWGTGAALTFGYQWSPRFRGELALGGTGHPAEPDGATAGTAVARFTGYVPLRTGATWEPHLIGGLSGWAAVFEPEGGKELAYLGVTGDAGVGFRLYFGRHWSMQMDYLHSAIDVDQEITDREGDQADMLQVGHRGRAELIRLGFLYDF